MSLLKVQVVELMLVFMNGRVFFKKMHYTVQEDLILKDLILGDRVPIDLFLSNEVVFIAWVIWHMEMAS